MKVLVATANDGDGAEIAALRTSVAEHLTGKCGPLEVGRKTYRGVPLVYFELML